MQYNLEKQIKDLINPVFDKELAAFKDELELSDHLPGSLPRTLEEKEDLIKAKEAELRGKFYNREIEERCAKGWEILFDETQNSEFASAIENLAHLNDPAKIDFAQEWSHMDSPSVQDCLGITNETFHSFYAKKG